MSWVCPSHPVVGEVALPSGVSTESWQPYHSLRLCAVFYKVNKIVAHPAFEATAINAVTLAVMLAPPKGDICALCFCDVTCHLLVTDVPSPPGPFLLSPLCRTPSSLPPSIRRCGCYSTHGLSTPSLLFSSLMLPYFRLAPHRFYHRSPSHP